MEGLLQWAGEWQRMEAAARVRRSQGARGFAAGDVGRG